MEEQKKFIPQWASPAVSLADQEIEIQKQLELIKKLRNMAEAGQMAGISVVVLHTNFVPEHVFSAAPFAGPMLLAGMHVAAFDLLVMSRSQMPEGGGVRAADTTSSPQPEAAQPDGKQGASSD